MNDFDGKGNYLGECPDGSCSLGTDTRGRIREVERPVQEASPDDSNECPAIPEEFHASQNPFKRQEGGDHYADLPEQYQPMKIADALGLKPWEYNVLKRLLRHRKKAKDMDLRKAIHDIELGISLEYPDDRRGTSADPA